MDEAVWEGRPDRECGEHRTTIDRAWCLACGEWCYPDEPCARCELPGLRAEVKRLRDEARDLDAAMHSVWFHGNWQWLTFKMTTAEKEAAADAVDRHTATYPSDDRGRPVDRWWRDDVGPPRYFDGGVQRTTFADLQAAQGTTGRVDPADLAIDGLTDEEREAFIDKRGGEE